MSDPSVLALPAQSPQDLVAPATLGKGTTPKEAAQQFEGMLLTNLFQQLRKTVHPSGLFGNGGNAQSTYEYLLDQAVVAHAMASGRSYGLRDRMEASLTAAKQKNR